MTGGKAAFQPGDAIVYGTVGVCRVLSVGVPEAAYIDPQKQYYTLAPVFGNETIHVPVDTGVFMRPALTKNEAQELIRRFPKIRSESLEGESQQSLSDHYRASLQSHRCDDLVRLLKTIYDKSNHAKSAGRKPYKVDDQYKKRAEALLYGELSVALGIPREEVAGYIARVLDPRGGDMPS